VFDDWDKNMIDCIEKTFATPPPPTPEEVERKRVKEEAIKENKKKMVLLLQEHELKMLYVLFLLITLLSL
jgi:hypothetical protein